MPAHPPLQNRPTRFRRVSRLSPFHIARHSRATHYATMAAFRAARPGHPRGQQSPLHHRPQPALPCQLRALETYPPARGQSSGIQPYVSTKLSPSHSGTANPWSAAGELRRCYRCNPLPIYARTVELWNGIPPDMGIGWLNGRRTPQLHPPVGIRRGELPRTAQWKIGKHSGKSLAVALTATSRS